MKFQDKLLTLRKEKEMSQENLAERIGVSRQAVAKWEAGQSCPDMEKLIALSDFFGISMDRLVKDFNDEECAYQYTKLPYIYNEKAIEFLRRAKRNCYAGHGGESIPSRPKSHDLSYEENNLKYIDTYLGGEKFAGEEAMWCDEVPFWSMNYTGRVLDGGFSGDFLKECLLLVPNEFPYRGPLVYRKGEYTYHCVVNGEFEWFSGYEEIFLKDTKVYECMFHGGCVK